MYASTQRQILMAAVSSIALVSVTCATHAQESAQGDTILLDTLIVQGDKVGRTQGEVDPSIAIINEDEIDRPINDTVISTINTVGNVVSEEGIQLPAIRGIDGSGGQSQAISAGTQPRVPILVDDVARPLNNSGVISLSSTWDVGSIEVARGPQSSSTGRNAIGGAIRVYTNDPSYDFEAAIRGEGFTAAEAARGGTGSGAGMLNIPLLDNQLAVRFTAEGSRGSTFVDVIDPTDFRFDPESEEFLRFRGKVLMEPEFVDNLSILFSADFIQSEGALRGFIDSDPDDATVSDFTNTNAFQINDQLSYGGRLTYQPIEDVELVARGSFIRNDFTAEDVFSGIGAFNEIQDETEFEAFVRVSDLGIISTAVLGFIRNNSTEDGSNDEPAASFLNVGEITNTGIYGEAEVDLSKLFLPEGLFLIAGGRFEIDDRTRVTTVLGDVISDQSFRETEFLPKVGLRYDINERLTVGYTFSEGFRPGGVDVDLFAPFFGVPTVEFSIFEPETLRQHEVFVKTSLLNDRLNLGASAFFYQYDDAQIPGASPTVGAFGTILTGNLPEARGIGFELDADFDIGDGFFARGSFGFLDTEITDAGPVLPMFEGEDLPRSPRFTASVGLAYFSDFGFNARADARFVGSQVSELGGATVDSYAVLDLSAGYAIETELTDIELNAYVQNVTDNRYFTFRSNVGTPFAAQAIGRPRTFGASVTARF